MNITRNFTLEELVRSPTASRLSIPNTPSVNVTRNLILLCNHILQPLRDAYGKPIIVNSGYRSPELNKAIGGAKNSQHKLGQAADIKGTNPLQLPHKGEGKSTGGSVAQENRKLFELIQKLNLPFDQLIDEKNYSWIHVSFSDKPRKQVLHLK